MKRRYSLTTLAAAAFLVSVLAPAPAQAQLWSWTKDQITEYTKAWTGERMPDGRPKVSDAMIERAKGLSMEEITINWGAAGVSAPGPGTASPAAGGGGGRVFSVRIRARARSGAVVELDERPDGRVHEGVDGRSVPGRPAEGPGCPPSTG